MFVCSVLENGQFDLMWDYMGMVVFVYNKIQDKLLFEEMYWCVKVFDVLCGFVWFDVLLFNDIYVIGLLSEFVQVIGICMVLQFVEYLKNDFVVKYYVFGMDVEFVNCFDGLKLLFVVYGMQFSCV